MFVDDRKNTSEYLNLCKEIKQKKKQLNQRNWDMDDDNEHKNIGTKIN